MPQGHSQEHLPASSHSSEILSVYDFSYELLPACSTPQSQPVVKKLSQPEQAGKYVVLVHLQGSSRTQYFLAKKLYEMYGEKSFLEYKDEVERYPASTYVVLKTNNYTEASDMEQFFLKNHCQVQLAEQSKVSGFSVF